MENFILISTSKMVHKSCEGVLRDGTDDLCIIKAATSIKVIIKDLTHESNVH